LSSLLDTRNYDAVISRVEQLESGPHNIYIFPDIHTWSILITCHSRKGNIYTAFSLFREIINTGHRPSTSNLNDLFKALCRKGQAYKAMLFYNYLTLKGGFQFNHRTYQILINGLCYSGETQRAIQLLRQVLLLKIDTRQEMYAIVLLYNEIILRLGNDRLVNQAYDLYSEMIVNNIKPDFDTHHHITYGLCVAAQFKEAISFCRELNYTDPSIGVQFFEIGRCKFNYIQPNIYAPNIVTEQEVKDAKSVVAAMVKGGVEPNIAGYHAVTKELYKGERVNEIVETVEILVSDRRTNEIYYSRSFLL
jgi:pentatricopeptide repeat protein